MDAELSGLAL
jgi:hypothetical protein